MSNENYKKNYECSICGRKFHTEFNLNEHYAACEKKQVKLNERENVIVSVMEFMQALNGRMTANNYDVGRMFDWFINLTGRNPGDITCSACVMHVYRVLNDIIANDDVQYLKYIVINKIKYI